MKEQQGPDFNGIAPCGKHLRRYWVEIITPDPDHAPADNPDHVSVASYCALCVVERLSDEVKQYKAVWQRLDELSKDGWTYTITNGRPDGLVGIALLKGIELDSPHAEAVGVTMEGALYAALYSAVQKASQ